MPQFNETIPSALQPRVAIPATGDEAQLVRAAQRLVRIEDVRHLGLGARRPMRGRAEPLDRGV